MYLSHYLYRLQSCMDFRCFIIKPLRYKCHRKSHRILRGLLHFPNVGMLSKSIGAQCELGGGCHVYRVLPWDSMKKVSGFCFAGLHSSGCGVLRGPYPEHTYKTSPILRGKLSHTTVLLTSRSLSPPLPPQVRHGWKVEKSTARWSSRPICTYYALQDSPTYPPADRVNYGVRRRILHEAKRSPAAKGPNACFRSPVGLPG